MLLVIVPARGYPQPFQEEVEPPDGVFPILVADRSADEDHRARHYDYLLMLVLCGGSLNKKEGLQL